MGVFFSGVFLYSNALCADSSVDNSGLGQSPASVHATIQSNSDAEHHGRIDVGRMTVLIIVSPIKELLQPV